MHETHQQEIKIKENDFKAEMFQTQQLLTEKIEKLKQQVEETSMPDKSELLSIIQR